MEGKSGFDVAQYLRHQCGMPFMFLSAFSDEQTVAQVKALGAVAYLVKPLDIKQIVPAVEAAFAHLEATRAAGVRRTLASAHRRAARTRATPARRWRSACSCIATRWPATRRRAAAAAGAGAERLTLHAQAELLLAAVEQLAGPARH